MARSRSCHAEWSRLVPMPKWLQSNTDLRRGWQPDPFGSRELRLFTPEGAPTAHVSTNGRNSPKKCRERSSSIPHAHA